MKKHIFGLAIFSFIVFAAAFIYGVFSYSESASIAVPQYIPAERKHCKFKQKFNESADDSAILTQAVYNLNTKTLSWEFPVSETNKYPTLYLLLKDDKGIRRLDSLRSENCMRGNKPMIFTKEYPRLSGLSSKTNLYLIADGGESAYSDESNDSIEFDVAKAIPVTIDYGN